MFQGSVSANVGLVAAFERILGKHVHIPQCHDVMGAYGAALLAKEEVETSGAASNFCGFSGIDDDFTVQSLECGGCSNMCEVVQIQSGGTPKAYFGDRCGKWSAKTSAAR